MTNLFIKSYNRIKEKAKHVSLPGFYGVSIYETISFFMKEVLEENIMMRSSALAFNFFISLFPATIFLFTLIPYIPIANLDHDILTLLKDVLPASAFSTIYDTLLEIIEERQVGLLSFGFFTALFLSVNAISSIISAFDKDYISFKKRSYLKNKLIAFFLTIALAFLMILAVSAIIVGEYLIQNSINLFHGGAELLRISFIILKWSTIILVFFNAISLIYSFGPNTNKRWGFVSPGSLLATILSLLASLFFRTYVNDFDTYNKLYGSIGAIMATMIWMYINSFALLVGFELNASIDVNRNLKKQKKKMQEKL